MTSKASYRTTNRVIKYLKENPDKTLAYRDIAEAVGLSLSHTSYVLTTLHNAGKLPISRLGPGMWIYNSRPAIHREESPDELYEKIGRATDGTPLVRSQDGIMYKLVQI